MTTPQRRSRSSRPSSRTHRLRRPSAIPSCSRTPWPTAPLSSSPRTSARPSRSALFALEPGAWQGPIESGYGWHLVFVSSSTPGRVPAFEEVEPDVMTAWKTDQRAEAWRKAYAEMRAKYELVLPAPPDEVASEGGPAEANATP